jgi:SAM-dependent methyltransferase
MVNEIKPQTSLGRRARQWLRRFPVLVYSRKRLRMLLYGEYSYGEIVNELPLFAPYSAGPFKALAQLTILAANQTFPFLVHFLEATGNEHIITSIVDAEQFCSDPESEKSAERLKCKFEVYGSDKSTLHNYHLIYGSILKNRESVSAVLEIGLGSNNADIVSNMKQAGKPGGSLRAFRDFLPNANIYGADVDKRILFEEDRIRTFFVDQTELQSFETLGKYVGTDFDLIIDDGLHSPNANIAVLAFALGRLKPGGWLVVEDISNSALPVWQVVAALIPAGYRPHLILARDAVVFAVERARSC